MPWQYFLRLCVRTCFEITALQEIISSLRLGRARRAGDYWFLLISKEKEMFGAVYRIEVYEGMEKSWKVSVIPVRR